MTNNSARDPRLNTANGIPVERLNNGKPIISPTEHWWETGVTFNPAAVYLEPNAENHRIIRELLPMLPEDDPKLSDGVVAIHYRARPENDPGSEFGRSFIGLALFTPNLDLLYRYPEPVLSPSSDPQGYDALGVEDPRISCFDGRYYMVYCGVQPDPVKNWKARLCLAVSDNLLHWTKLGTMTGDVANWSNKDSVFFPHRINGRYYLLHRPFAESWPHSEYTIRLAECPTLHGSWKDLGEMMKAYPNPRVVSTWIGAGSEPLRLNDQRYLHIYHTGNYLSDVDREYDIGAALIDFSRFDPANPSEMVVARLEPLMVPETPAELRSRSQLQVGNVLFACGSYLYQGWLYIIYGGADTYTLAARVKLSTLLEGLEQSGLKNPFAG